MFLMFRLVFCVRPTVDKMTFKITLRLLETSPPPFDVERVQFPISVESSCNRLVSFSIYGYSCRWKTHAAVFFYTETVFGANFRA